MKKFIAVCGAALLLLAGCGAKEEVKCKDDKVITIGASTTPHAEILNYVKPKLEKEGYKVVIKEYTDYVKPNTDLVEGDLDANFFQHEPYLLDWAKKAEKSDSVESALTVHFEPIGIYSVKYTSLEDVKDGSKIAIPNDPTNGGRALQLLAENNIITLEKGKGVDATLKDIKTYNKKVEIIEMQAETCAINIQDVDYSVINGNNALNAKLTDKVIVTESKDGEGAKTYGNIIAIRSIDKDHPKIKAIVKALNSEDVKNFINEKYHGIVVPLVPQK